jgi:uncharacterized protein YacL
VRTTNTRITQKTKDEIEAYDQLARSIDTIYFDDADVEKFSLKVRFVTYLVISLVIYFLLTWVLSGMHLPPLLSQLIVVLVIILFVFGASEFYHHRSLEERAQNKDSVKSLISR